MAHHYRLKAPLPRTRVAPAPATHPSDFILPVIALLCLAQSPVALTLIGLLVALAFLGSGLHSAFLLIRRRWTRSRRHRRAAARRLA